MSALHGRWQRLLRAAEFLDLAVDGDRDVFAGGDVAELDDPVAFAGELSPAARLLRILFDRLVGLASGVEADGAQPLRAGARDGKALPFHGDGLGVGHLGRDGRDEGVIEHVSHFVGLILIAGSMVG